MKMKATHWARRDTRWDVYPQHERAFPVTVTRVGAFSEIRDARTGCELRMGVVLVRECNDQDAPNVEPDTCGVCGNWTEPGSGTCQPCFDSNGAPGYLMTEGEYQQMQEERCISEDE
jgi:hypothetical protein